MSAAEHTRPVIGFLGLGAIGAPIALRLIQAGHKVVIYNRTLAKTVPFKGRAHIAATPAEVARKADHVFGCVTTADSYREILLGEHGIVRGGRVKTYIHIGTNDAALLEELAVSLCGHGIATLDAPMTGGVARAVNGTLTVMASGSREVFATIEPFLKAYANKIVYLSDRVGAAQLMKLVNNVLSASNLALACEAMMVGRKGGLDPSAMLEIINNGSGQNSATLTKIPAQILTRKFAHGGAIGLMVKDLEAFTSEAGLRGLAIPLTEAVIESFITATAVEGEKEDLTKVVCPMERAAGVTLAAAKSPEEQQQPVAMPVPVAS